MNKRENTTLDALWAEYGGLLFKRPDAISYFIVGVTISKGKAALMASDDSSMWLVDPSRLSQKDAIWRKSPENIKIGLMPPNTDLSRAI